MSGVADEAVRRDLDRLNYPPADWVPSSRHPSGARVHDVVILGGGMAGLTAAFALRARGISDLRILDRNPAGREGPWLNTARMETLRSPKELTGPASGLASLTFRAWFEARSGLAEWERMYRIPRPLWAEYLAWYRRVLDLPVENGVAVAAIVPDAGYLRLDLAAGGTAFARELVLATGRDGLSHPTIPAFAGALPRETWSHSSDDIGFSRLRGRRVVVVGAGAAAMDNAASALEAGAREVRLLIRRRTMPLVNKLMGVGHPGFIAAFPTLSDAWRWRIIKYSQTEQVPAPRNSTQRVSRHANAFFHFNSAIARAEIDRGAIALTTVRGRRFDTDHLILATGFSVDLDRAGEVQALAPGILRWSDVYRPPPELADDGMGRFPYLAPDFSFVARPGYDAPWLSQIHCFCHAANLSLGKITGDIPRISEGAARLADAIAARLYTEDIETHFRLLEEYSKPELLGDEWVDADAPALTERVA